MQIGLPTSTRAFEVQSLQDDLADASILSAFLGKEVATPQPSPRMHTTSILSIHSIPIHTARGIMTLF